MVLRHVYICTKFCQVTSQYMENFKVSLRAHDYSSNGYNCVNTISRDTCILHADRYMLDVCLPAQEVDYKWLYVQVQLGKYGGTADHMTLDISYEIFSLLLTLFTLFTLTSLPFFFIDIKILNFYSLWLLKDKLLL